MCVVLVVEAWKSLGNTKRASTDEGLEVVMVGLKCCQQLCFVQFLPYMASAIAPNDTTDDSSEYGLATISISQAGEFREIVVSVVVFDLYLLKRSIGVRVKGEFSCMPIMTSMQISY